MPPLHKLLPFLTLVLPVAAQSDVGGDLSKSAPYGLPPDKFSSDTSQPMASANFSIPGYNVSAPAGSEDGHGNAVDGWHLSVAVAADVPLADAGDGSVDKSKATEATTLALWPPGGSGSMALDKSWRLCAIVYPGLGVSETSRAADDEASVDGTCARLLPSDCIKQLQVKELLNDSGCVGAGIPEKCKGHFAEGVEMAFGLSADVIAANRFYALGSAPTSPGNDTALGIAKANVWPVILTWTRLTSAGEVSATNAYLACVRTRNSSSPGDNSPSSTSHPSPSPSSGSVGTMAFRSRWTALLVFPMWTFVLQELRIF